MACRGSNPAESSPSSGRDMNGLSMSGFSVPGKGNYLTLASADKTFEAHVRICSLSCASDRDQPVATGLAADLDHTVVTPAPPPGAFLRHTKRTTNKTHERIALPPWLRFLAVCFSASNGVPRRSTWIRSCRSRFPRYVFLDAHAIKMAQAQQKGAQEFFLLLRLQDLETIFPPCCA